jgi:hypothetical protein
MSTVAHADAEFDASTEVAVAVSFTRRWLRSGALRLACTSTCCPLLSPPTLHTDLPDGWQTEKVGDTLLGDADRLILAVALVPLLIQIQMANLTVACGSTELSPLRVWIFRHRVPGGGFVGVVVGVGVGVGVLVGVGVTVLVGVGVAVAVGVAIGDLRVPPGVMWFGLLLCAGAGSGSAVLGAADEPGLGCGWTAVLARGLGWVLGDGDEVLADARRTASARSTGMPAGCWARPLVWMPARVLGCVWGSVPAGVVLGAGLSAAEVVHALVLAWRVACTPVSIMLIAL